MILVDTSVIVAWLDKGRGLTNYACAMEAGMRWFTLYGNHDKSGAHFAADDQT